MRLAAIIGVLYICVWVVMFIPNMIYGSIFVGVWWSAGGPGMLFPIPIYPGNLAVGTLANPLDTILYLLFLQAGIWIVWLAILGLYAFSPYSLKLKQEI